MKIVAVYTGNSHLLMLKVPTTVGRLQKCFEVSLLNSVCPDQTAPASSLIWGPDCLPLYLWSPINRPFVLAF